MESDGATPADPVIAGTLAWVRELVVGLQLCPFAQRELARGALRCTVTRAEDGAGLLAALDDELARLDRDPALATTLLVAPDLPDDFFTFNAAVARADKRLRRSGRDGVYQVVPFHPGFQFADAATDDPGNWVNRSPWPMLHILREADIGAAAAAHPDPAGIPERNARVLREVGVERLRALVAGCCGAAGR